MLKAFVLSTTVSLFSIHAFAQAQAPQGKNNPCANPKLSSACQQICQVCSGAGYVFGQMGKGNGLMDDCVRPIIQGVGEPAKAQQAGHTLPSVPASTISQCKTANPRFGEGKIK